MSEQQPGPGPGPSAGADAPQVLDLEDDAEAGARGEGATQGVAPVETEAAEAAEEEARRGDEEEAAPLKGAPSASALPPLPPPAVDPPPSQAPETLRQRRASGAASSGPPRLRLLQSLGVLAPAAALRSSLVVVALGHFFLVAALPALRYFDAYSLDPRLVWLPYTQGGGAALVAAVGCVAASSKHSTLWSTLYAVAALLYGGTVAALTVGYSAVMVELCSLEQTAFAGCGSCVCEGMHLCTQVILDDNVQCDGCLAYAHEVCAEFVDGGLVDNGFNMDAMAAGVICLMSGVAAYFGMQLTVRQQAESSALDSGAALAATIERTGGSRSGADFGLPARQAPAQGQPRVPKPLLDATVSRAVKAEVARVRAEVEAASTAMLQRGLEEQQRQWNTFKADRKQAPAPSPRGAPARGVLAAARAPALPPAAPAAAIAPRPMPNDVAPEWQAMVLPAPTLYFNSKVGATTWEPPGAAGSSAEGSSVTSVSAVASPGDYMDVTAPDVVSGLYDDGVTGTKSANAWKSPRI